MARVTLVHFEDMCTLQFDDDATQSWLGEGLLHSCFHVRHGGTCDTKERNALRKGRNGAKKNKVETLDEND